MPKPLVKRGNYQDYAHLRMLRPTLRKTRDAVQKWVRWLECEHPSWPARYERDRVGAML